MAPLCKAPIPKWSKTMPKPTVCKRHQGGKRKAAGATKHSKSKVVVAKIPPQLQTQIHQLQNEGWKNGSGQRGQRTAWHMICSIASMNLSISPRRKTTLDLKVWSECMLWDGNFELWGLLSSELSQSLGAIGNGMFKHKAEQEANTSLSKSLCSGGCVWTSPWPGKTESLPSRVETVGFGWYGHGPARLMQVTPRQHWPNIN